MSESSEHFAADLYCDESAGEVVSSNGELCCCIHPPAYSDDFSTEAEAAIVDHMFDSELDQIPAPEAMQLLERKEIVTARRDVVNWMLKVHSYYNFRHQTAYLSVNYLDRFLCSRALPGGKRWAWQLLAVACLSLAAKMEETNVPLLVNLQVLAPKFVFKPRTVQRMELLVMASLRWRLRVITPFDFVDYFIPKPHFCGVFSSVWDLILATCRVIGFLKYTPSTIAAAALLYTVDGNVPDRKIVFLHDRVSKEMVKRCRLMLEEHLIDGVH
ncbi:cyclin-D1-1-like [Diospyros lotus]|uniref:cyclin-D1-1-like n=1 Tax=Diospyros lotus TaxID=55363 RepID=UPI00225A6F3A|nr:cyclin-D1-1-like [Diospyros lotus]